MSFNAAAPADATAMADQYAMQDAFRRLSDNCYRKCVRRYEASSRDACCLLECVLTECHNMHSLMAT